jgi:C4-dicarboxylate-specific signal transduction histidine kinase
MTQAILNFWLFYVRHSWRGELLALFCQPHLWKRTLGSLSLGVQSSGVFHDLGNTTMILRFLHAEFVPQLTNRQNRELTAHLENLSQQLTEGFSFLAQEEPESCKFSVRECSKEALHLFNKHPLHQRGLVRFQAKNDFYLTGSPLILTQALTNILQNSAQALQKQNTREILVTISKRKDLGVITIQDNGPGFPHNYRPRLFVSSKASGKGIGLWHSCLQLRRYLSCTQTFRNLAEGGAQTNLYFWKLQ